MATEQKSNPISIMFDRIFICAFAIVGVCFFVFGVGYAAFSLSRSSHTKGVDGVVVDFEKRTDSDGGDMTVPVVEYEVDGNRYRTTGSVAFSPNPNTLGQAIHVLYKENRPAEGYVDSFMERWLFPVVFTLAGAIMAAVGYVKWRYRHYGHSFTDDA